MYSKLVIQYSRITISCTYFCQYINRYVYTSRLIRLLYEYIMYCKKVKNHITLPGPTR